MAISQADAHLTGQEEPADLDGASGSMPAYGGALPEPAEHEEATTVAAAAPNQALGESANAGALGRSALPKLHAPLRPSERPEENGVKLVNLLNPNNPQYDQAFALEYARMK